MIRGGTVNFIHDLEVGDDAIQLDVTAEVSDYYPAVMYLRHGDPGYPAEGGEVESLTVYMPDGSEMHPVPDDLYDTLCDKAEEEHNQ